MAVDEEFDLQAASLRADGAQLAMSVEVLATKLEEALPQIAAVERRRVGGFRSKQREVQRIVLALGDQHFELRRAAEGLRCSRQKVVRGITLSRQEVSPGDWLSEVIAAVTRMAEVSEQSRVSLEGLLR